MCCDGLKVSVPQDPLTAVVTSWWMWPCLARASAWPPDDDTDIYA